MKPLVTFAAWLDRKAFLSCRLWEFNLHNLSRWYPWYYLFTALFRHPRKTVRGFRRYQKQVHGSPGIPLDGTISYPSLLHRLAANQRKSQRLLLAPGFCMKPYNEEKNKCLCPAGHFNHRCLVAEQTALLNNARDTWPEPCAGCGIGALVKLAAGLGADFYIMTSAIDIARHVFHPALQGNGAATGLFLLCPYSTEAFTFGLATSGIDGSLVTFCAGDCRNHTEFTQADIGIKEKQTSVLPSVWQWLTDDLSAAANDHHKIPGKSTIYECTGHVYRFKN